MRSVWYQVSTGWIIGVQESTHATVSEFYLPDDRGVVEIDSDDYTTSAKTHYVVAGAVTDRPEMGASAAVVDTTITISDLVVGTTVLVFSEVLEEYLNLTASSDTIEITDCLAGIYIILIILWPYQVEVLSATVAAS